MKPLVLWSRWHDARIRLHGRDAEKVWGELDFWKENKRVQFQYKLSDQVLILENDENDHQEILLDEMGVESKS